MNISNLALRKVWQYLQQQAGETRISLVVRFAVLAIAVAVGAWVVYFVSVATVWPFQLEYREGAPLVMTRLLMEGQNPFSFANQPLAANNYGILYNLSVLPVAAVFGNTLLAHRVVTVFFILLCFLMVIQEVFAANRDLGVALVCAETLMVGLAAIGGMGAFPGSMGTFFFLAALLIPFRRDFDRQGLILSAIFCLLAFYTKPYFMLAFGIVASYLFLFVSPKNAVGYGSLFAAILLISVLLVKTVFPLYFVDTFISNLTQGEITVWGKVYSELKVLATEFYPSLIAAMVILLVSPWRILQAAAAGVERPSPAKLPFPDRPLIFQRPDFFFYSFTCSLLTFIFVLGPHTFNLMNALPYSYQIVLPPFFLWLARQLKPRSWPGWLLTLLLTFNVVTFSYARLSPSMLDDLRKSRATWESLQKSIRGSERILNSPLVVSEIMKQGRWPIDSGQTEFYFETRNYPHMELLRPAYETIQEHGDLYLHSIRAGVREQTFDSIIQTEYDVMNRIMKVYRDQNNLNHHYQLEQKMTLLLPLTSERFSVAIWLPRKN